MEIKGALSDLAVAAALSQADLPWLPGVPAAARSQFSEQLFQLLQATGIALPYLDQTYAGASCMPHISAIFSAVFMVSLFACWAGTYPLLKNTLRIFSISLSGLGDSAESISNQGTHEEA